MIVLRVCGRCGIEKRPKEYLSLDHKNCKDCSMTVVTVDAIKDFQVCSLFYDYRFNQKIHEPVNNRVIMADRFHETLSRVAAFFFYKKQSGITPSYNAIVNRWERLWFPKDMDAYDLALEQHTVSHGNLAHYSNIAVMGLKKLYEDFESMDIQPMLIDEDFSVPVGPEVILDGKFDLVYRDNGVYNVVKWSTKKKKPNPESMQMEFASLKLAYDHRKPPGQNVKYHIYDLGSDNPGNTPVNMMGNDSGLIKFWSEQIREQEYVPRRGYTAYCKGCPFDEECASFSFEMIGKKNGR